MSAPKGDRRQHPRAPIELKVEYKSLNTFFYDFTRNISKGGTFIRTSRPLDIGTEFLFKLVIARLPEPLALRGTVKWTVQEGEGETAATDAGMGIEFIYADAAERQQLDDFVGKLVIQELGEGAYEKLIKGT